MIYQDQCDWQIESRYTRKVLTIFSDLADYTLFFFLHRKTKAKFTFLLKIKAGIFRSVAPHEVLTYLIFRKRVIHNANVCV